MTSTGAALQFLRAILPDEGYKCAYVVDGDRKWNQFFASHEDLLNFILTQDGLGKTVYHACATFKVPENDSRHVPRNQRTLGRTAHNVLNVSAFWADVDAGEGKPYPDAEAAYAALQCFLTETGFPQPIVVGSGNGIHIYWPLQEILEPEEWRKLATNLKGLFVHHGFRADPTRTADISSVLRTPGTHHRKHGEKIVRVGEIFEPYSLDEFGALNDRPTEIGINDQQSNVPARLRPQLGNFAGSGRRNLVAAAINIYGNEPTFAEPIAAQCKQLGAFRETGGNIAEPLWYAGLGVLAFCTDGREFGHAWSSSYRGYSHAETEDRLDRAGEFGPTTCSKFAGLDPAACKGCPFAGRITSPIQLGRVAVEHQPQALGDGVTRPDDGKPAPWMAPGVQAPVVGNVSIPLPPPSFAYRGQALVYLTEKKNLKGGADEAFKLISNNTIYVDNIQGGELTDKVHTLNFQIFFPKAGWKVITLDAGTFFSSGGIAEMAKQGAVIHDSDLFKRFVRESMDTYHENRDLERRYDQFGWKDDTRFLYGDRLYEDGEHRPASGSAEIGLRSQWLAPARNGSIEKWTDAASQLFAAGCEAQSFALLCSFAAPLMRFHSTTEGGAIVSLLSRGSGTGKSTSLAAVASVWGQDKGLALTNIDTKVAKGLTLGVLGHLPVIYDELTNRDPAIIKEFVIVFTNGRDKMRGTADAQIQHTQASWQTILVSASNQPLVDLLSAQGTDAQAFRVLEFEATLPKEIQKNLGDRLKMTLQQNAGHAGDLYLRYLTQHETLEWVKTQLPKVTDEIWARTKLDSQHRFWVRTLASVALAGQMVRQLDLVSFSPERIVDWAVEQLISRAKDEAESGITGNERYNVNVLSEFLNDNIDSILVVADKFKPQQRQMPIAKPWRKLHIRYELNTGMLYISEAAFKEWLGKRELALRHVVRDLHNKLIVLRPRHQFTLGAGTDLASGQMPCIEVNARHPMLSGTLASVDELSSKLEALGASPARPLRDPAALA